MATPNFGCYGGRDVPRRNPSSIAVLAIVVALTMPAGRLAAEGADLPASLRRLTLDADAVVRARVVATSATIDAGSVTYPLVHVEVLATLKGAVAPGPLAFASIGAGAARYLDGENVVVFLQHSQRIPALAATTLPTRLAWVAIPNAGEKLGSDPAVLDAVRRYVALDVLQDPDARGDALRALSLQLLQSGEPILVTSVLRDLTPGGDAGALTLADLPALVPVIESSRVPIGTRIALVAELERRGLVFGPARWVRLLRTSQGSDFLAVLRAVREHPSAGVNAQLIPLLGDRDLEVATAAATALGAPGNVEAVHPLAASLARPDAELRHAALASLTRIGTQSARQALELTAARHPDPALRRQATIEAIVLARRHGTTLAPLVGVPTAPF
ncbi:MAG: HEAT repeat domain-containing protein [Deltaproteobacteria bacterium]|nr:HEAT repeat domain-containing protein [Deltaproteobacteria bacterium]